MPRLSASEEVVRMRKLQTKPVRDHHHDEHAKNCRNQSEKKKRAEDDDVATGDGVKKSSKEFVVPQQIGASYYCIVTSIVPDFSLKQTPTFQFPMKQTYCGVDAGENFLDIMCQTADKIYKKYIRTPKKRFLQKL